MAGLSVGGFIAIVLVILILNVGGVFGYYKFMEKNPDKAVSVNMDAGLVPTIRYGLVGLIFLSWMFSIACTATCTFVSAKTPVVIFGTVKLVDRGLGLRGIEDDTGDCITGDIGDDRVRTAYAFAVINILLTTTALIGCLVVVLNQIKEAAQANKIWKIMGFLMLASTWCCLFTFYIQETTLCDALEGFYNIECSLGGAGVAQVFNSMFLIGICVLFFALPAPAEGGESSAKTDNKEKNEDEEKQKEEPSKSKESDEEGEEGDFVNAEEEE